MNSMTSRISREPINESRRPHLAAITAPISLLVLALVMPLCPAAAACMMPCCDHSVPAADHAAMPPGGCHSTEGCSLASPQASETLYIVAGSPATTPPVAPHALVDSASAVTASSVVQPFAHRASRHLYVVNDVFLI